MGGLWIDGGLSYDAAYQSKLLGDVAGSECVQNPANQQFSRTSRMGSDGPGHTPFQSDTTMRL